MLTKIGIKAFKSFVDQSVKLSNLTLLSGLNNSGKSSIIQCIRMYAAAYKNESPLLDGHGEVEELRSDFVRSTEQIEIRFDFENGQNDSMILSDHETTLPKIFPEFMYVCADRLGPQAFLPLNLALDSKPKVGDRGEFTLDFIDKLSKYGYLVPESLSHKNVSGVSFEYALRGWITEIAPGVEFKFSTLKKASIAHAEIDSYRPTNVGFGLSYTLPIIAATLGAAAVPPTLDLQDDWVKEWERKKSAEGVFLVLENPEAHLHPQGQTAMGKLIALAASTGVQILVETHSEHVMDGVRIAVKEGLISSSEVTFHYLSKNNSGISEIKTPILDDNGKLDFWPEGFFDQTLKNRAILAKKGY